ncbi:MAG: 1-(5-phosphoribosyl)-5-[(5-phosphoribosylamino)methylideneamino]imidazole-4-carboxamide isomerase [Nitrospinae bacterium]|nr:1-(5-phosphoribosyl)-5-[(5-phosphoribosylamino)methylideneamino]imidazole-4-carboxamide isomerase [Nitrospinota bacterium]
MVIIPAIDIKEGRCVRLVQGDMQQETVFNSDPVAQAKKWEAGGARLIHIVDLDGAVEGTPKNADLIRQICGAVKCAVQLGGGVRSRETAEQYLALGVRRVVLGTLLIKNMPLAEEIVRANPYRVMAGIDARDGMVAGDGWTTASQVPASKLAQTVAGWPLAGIIFTDIARDGMMGGPNLKEIESISSISALPFVASGGISGMNDLEDLFRIPAVTAAIIGKALYTGAIRLEEAIEKYQKGG